MRLRKLNFVVHRDLGYLCIGLTLIYAISGIAVNHKSHGFNPSYTIERSSATVSPIGKDVQPDMAYVQQVLTELNETAQFKNVASLGPDEIRLFIDGSTIDVNMVTGMVVMEKISRKPVLYAVNMLHLNRYKKGWTWVADIYAVSLILLALTGLFMIRGKAKVRGIMLTTAGFLVPLVFLFILM